MSVYIQVSKESKGTEAWAKDVCAARGTWVVKGSLEPELRQRVRPQSKAILNHAGFVSTDREGQCHLGTRLRDHNGGLNVRPHGRLCCIGPGTVVSSESGSLKPEVKTRSLELLSSDQPGPLQSAWLESLMPSTPRPRRGRVYLAVEPTVNGGVSCSPLSGDCPGASHLGMKNRRRPRSLDWQEARRSGFRSQGKRHDWPSNRRGVRKQNQEDVIIRAVSRRPEDDRDAILKNLEDMGGILISHIPTSGT